jgi:predicted Fe-Mo cluster-binding NifX family protein
MRTYLKFFYSVIFFSIFFFQVQTSLVFSHISAMDNSNSSYRIAIAVTGDSVTSELSNRAGRAPYYLVFDGNGVFLKSLVNPSRSQGRRASLGVLGLLKKESVKTVIAGRIGAKMKKSLELNNIEYFERSGIAEEILETILKNKQNKNTGK